VPGAYGRAALSASSSCQARCVDEHDLLAAIDDALKFEMTWTSPNDLLTPLASSATRPDGRFIVNLMYGRWMFDSRQLGRLQPLDLFLARHHLLARVPAKNRAMKSCSCAIFFIPLLVVGFHTRANLRLREHHVVVAAGIRDDVS